MTTLIPAGRLHAGHTGMTLRGIDANAEVTLDGLPDLDY